MPRPLHIFLGNRIRRILPVLVLMAGAAAAACLQAPRPAVREAQVVWPKPPHAPRIRFLQAFSSLKDLGVREGWLRRLGRFLTGGRPSDDRLVAPSHVCVDGKGRSYVTDTATRSVHVIDRRRGVHREVTLSGARRLLSPIGVAAHEDGRLFFSDSMQGLVFVCETSGLYRASIGAGVLNRPTGIALDGRRGRLYVVDTAAHMVQAYSLEGELLFTIGRRGSEPGSFNFPTCIALDREGRIFVGDTLNFRVQVFDPEGNYLFHFGEAGDGTGYFFQIKGVAVDSEGHIYVSDASFDVVQVFSRVGEYLLSIGGPGDGPGEFHMPLGLYIDDRDRVHIVDRLNQRVQVLQYLSEQHE